MAQTKLKASQFYGVSGNGTSGQVLISDGSGGMSWGANTEQFTISWATPTGQSLTYSTPSPQSSIGTANAPLPTTTFTATRPGYILSGTATIAGLPSGITATQTITGSGGGNILTVTLTGTFPALDYLNTNLTLSGLTISVPITVDYLVSAGGGGGASGYIGIGSGGGGAGGLRSSYGNASGTPAWVNETTFILSLGTNYSVTIGAGGAGSSLNDGEFGGIGGNGSSSVFHSITSIGGGGARSYANNSAPSSSGGSGGGGTYQNTAGTANASPSQGNNGGAGSLNGSGYGGGGGGGAGSVGGNGSPSTAGAGGDGLEVNIIGGTGNFYGGGGGGSSSSGSGQPGTGGLGGSGVGGNGGVNAPGLGASANKGSGGGAGGGTPSNPIVALGGAGSSGVVILRYPNTYTISGLSGTTTTVGTDKVTTFTSGTGNIQFN